MKLSDFHAFVRDKDLQGDIKFNTTFANKLDAKRDIDLLYLLREAGPYIPQEVLKEVVNVHFEKHDNSIVRCSLLDAHCLLTMINVEKANQLDIIRIAHLVCSFIVTQNKLQKSKRIVSVYYSPILGEKHVSTNTTNKTLTCLEVNSGVTLSNTVLLFRHEEVLKVLIHELIHAFQVDLEIPNDMEHIGIQLAQKHNVSSVVPIRLNETFTETYASFMNVIASRHLTDAQMLKKLEKMKQAFLSQSEKILCMMMFANNGKARMDQATHVFEYYIVKAALFWERTPMQVLHLIDLEFTKENIESMLREFARSTDKYLLSATCSLRMSL